MFDRLFQVAALLMVACFVTFVATTTIAYVIAMSKVIFQ